MTHALKSLLRFLVTRVSVATYERALAHSILRESFESLRSARVYQGRQQLWDDCLLNHVGGRRMTFVEFGVHTGNSISYFARNHPNKDSVFIGLDSFEGLPEAWHGMPKGSFDTHGAVPRIDDPRVRFIKGWFQKTWGNLVEALPPTETLVVHYDADLYSSTLFALTKIDSLKTPYLAIFDEFAGHEARALHNYVQSYNASVGFLGKTVGDGYPAHVLCKIDPG